MSDQRVQILGDQPAQAVAVTGTLGRGPRRERQQGGSNEAKRKQAARHGRQHNPVILMPQLQEDVWPQPPRKIRRRSWRTRKPCWRTRRRSWPTSRTSRRTRRRFWPTRRKSWGISSPPSRSSRGEGLQFRRLCMTHKTLVWMGRVAVTATLAAAPALVSGQSTPRTPWGDPDIQGTWTTDETIGVPVQRPPELGTKAFLTDADLAARDRQARERAAAAA